MSHTHIYSPYWTHALGVYYLARAVSSPEPDCGKAVVSDFVRSLSAVCPQFVTDFVWACAENLLRPFKVDCLFCINFKRPKRIFGCQRLQLWQLQVSKFSGLSLISGFFPTPRTPPPPPPPPTRSEDAWKSGMGYSIFKKMPELSGASPPNPHILLHFLSYHFWLHSPRRYCY